MGCRIFMIPHSVYQMDPVNYFKDLFDSISDIRKIVLLIFSIRNDEMMLNFQMNVGFFEK